MILADTMNSSEVNLPHEQHIQRERLAAVLEMVSGLAHGSRNSLQRAQSCLDLLELELAGQSELLQLTERIRTSLGEMHRNYEEVKSYATPTTLRYSETDLPQLCQTTFDELVRDRSDITPVLRIDSHLGCESVKLDPSRTKELLGHVLQNAIDANPRDGTIQFACRLTANGSVEIELRDHGTGLTDEVSQRMFHPFFTTKQHGTGLGLAVCRRIVQAHGGAIEAKNHPDGGAMVTIEFSKQ